MPKPFERKGWHKPEHSWTNHYFGRIHPKITSMYSSLCGARVVYKYEEFHEHPQNPDIYPICRVCFAAESGVKRHRRPRRPKRSLAPREIIEPPNREENQEYFCPKGVREGTNGNCTFMEEGNYTFHVDAWGNYTPGGDLLTFHNSISCNTHEGVQCYRSKEDALNSEEAYI